MWYLRQRIVWEVRISWEVDVLVISNKECKSAKGSVNGYSSNYEDHIFNSMLCTFKPGQDACQGDSGECVIFYCKWATNNICILTLNNPQTTNTRRTPYHSGFHIIGRYTGWSDFMGCRLCYKHFPWRVCKSIKGIWLDIRDCMWRKYKSAKLYVHDNYIWTYGKTHW